MASMPVLTNPREDEEGRRHCTGQAGHGERKSSEGNGPYTVLVQGKPLGDESFRIDCWNLEEGLAYIIVNFARKCWGLETGVTENR